MSSKPKHRILNVNDSDAGRYATSRILTHSGFEVIEAATGMEALRLAAQRPDLVLLDVNLPDLSGFEVCKRIKADPSLVAIPVVHLSATRMQRDDRVEGLEGCADGYLVQPVDSAELVATIRAFLRLTAAESALREGEERLRLALKAARMGTFDQDMERKQLVWSPEHEALFGYPPGEFNGTAEAFEERIHPQDRPGLGAELARCMVARASFTYEFRSLWPDGSEHWVASAGEFIFNDAGQVVRMRGVTHDITGRKQAEQESVRQLDELRRWQTVMLTQTDRNIALKDEVNALLRRLNEPIRYATQAGSGEQTPSTDAP